MTDIKNGERTKKPPLPFTTSTLQQEASKALNFSTQKTMRLAQQLYEGVDVKGHGTVGLITYLRTDSTRVAEEAEKTASSFIVRHYGEAYLSTAGKDKEKQRKDPGCPRGDPSDRYFPDPDAGEGISARDQFRLYQLIWKRFTASRMSAAVYETTSVKIGAGGNEFTMTASRLKFDGFMSVYIEADEKEEKNQLLSQTGKRRGAGACGSCERPALYPAAGPLHRGIPGKSHGGTGHWPSEYLRSDDHDDPGPPLCGQRE